MGSRSKTTTKPNKRARRARAKFERRMSQLMAEQKSQDKTAFAMIRVRLDSVPGAIPCSMHPLLEGAEHTFIIHSRGTPDLALYFCVDCQRELTQRLVKDFLSYPRLAQQMGSLRLPDDIVEALSKVVTDLLPADDGGKIITPIRDQD
jgi:hypothetical protein